jgi:pimeloyl-ACP methyl ester carboxylesterase
MDAFEVTDGGVTIVGDRGGVGEPLVLVHGFTGSRLDWVDVIDELRAGNDVIRFDNRGHGESTSTGDEASYTIDALTSDLPTVVDELGIGRFHLLGHSLGGIVAMRFAITHADRLRSLILMDTAGAAIIDENAAAMFEAGIELVRANGLMSLYDLAAPALGEGPRAEEIRARVKTKFSQMDPAAFVALGHALLSYDSMLDALAGLDVPTTVIVGENDIGIRAGCERLAETIPSAELVVIAGAGHSPQEDDPAAWLAALRQHLAGVVGS